VSVQIVAEGLKDHRRFFERMPEIAMQAARLALNETASGKGMRLLRTSIEEEIDFPKGYVNRDRLFLKKPARNNDLEVVMAARTRPTSLARFVRGGQDVERSRLKGVRVSLKGTPKAMRGAFLVKLLRGRASIADGFNIGLALRLKDGERVRNKRVMVGTQLDTNLYLLYGPSVDQVFRDVAAEQTPAFLTEVDREFTRQFVRLTR
jgi:hypothetical protein